MPVIIENVLAQAILLGVAVHQNQMDKGGRPYFLHPLRMVLRTKDCFEQMTAALHDVVEDSHVTILDLRRRGFPDNVVDAVDALTRRRRETYDEFIDRVCTNDLAMRVKLLDLEDNMDLSRLTDITERDVERNRRYAAARSLIESRLADASPR